MRYALQLTVKEIQGRCPLYKVGDSIVIREFYIDVTQSKNICIHMFTAMSTILSALLHGTSAKELGIGETEDIGYLQCPDPGPPYTKGGTVLFEIRRINLTAHKKI